MQTVSDGSRAEIAPPPYAELQFSSPVSDFTLELCNRAWTHAPILAGAGLRLTHPPVARELLRVGQRHPDRVPVRSRHAGAWRRMPGWYASHNVEAQKFPSWSEAVGRPFTSPLWCRLIERYERRAVGDADLVIAVSEDDRAEFVRRYGADPDSIVVIPNGADTTAYGPILASQRAAAKQALGLPTSRRCSSRPRAPAQCRRSALDRAPCPPSQRSDVPGHRRSAPMSATTRATWSYQASCGLRDLPWRGRHQHLPDRAPEVERRSSCSSRWRRGSQPSPLPSGCRSTAIEDGEHVIVASKTEDSLLASVELIARDVEHGARLGRNARAIAVERYDWEKISSRLEAILTGDRSFVDSGHSLS